MGKIISIVGFILIIIGMAFGFGSGKEVSKAAFSPPKPIAQDELKKVESTLDQAAITHPDLPHSLAKAQEAQVIANAQLNKKNSLSEKLISASNQFSGFYYVNAVTRPKYCARLGVDITSFVNNFKLAHSEEYRISADSLALRNYTPESLGARLDSSYSSQMNQAMQDMANMNKVSTADLCASFAQNATYFVDAYSLKKISPAIYAALHGY